MQVVLRNQTINLLAARELIALANTPGAGLSEIAQKLAALSLNDVERLGLVLQISVTVLEETPDPRSATSTANDSNSSTAEDALNYYVRHGATRKMIKDHLGAIRNGTISKIRSQLSVSTTKPKSIPNTVAVKILDHWGKIVKQSQSTSGRLETIANQLIELHKQFREYDISLAALYALINEL